MLTYVHYCILKRNRRMKMVYNYWTDKIAFKQKIETKLLPLLKPFIGTIFNQTQVDDVKKKVADWMDNLDDVLFDCSITFEIEKKTGTDGQMIETIKVIKVVPLDV